MVTDLLVCAIVIAAAVLYSRRGFAMSVMSILQWFLSLTIGLLLCDELVRLLRFIGIGKLLTAHFSKLLKDDSLLTVVQFIPQVFNGWLSGSSEVITETHAQNVTTAVLACFAYLVILIVSRVLCHRFVLLFHRHETEGLVSFVDMLAGIVCGTCLGIFYVFVFFLILLLVIACFPGSLGQLIYDSLSNSFFSGDLFKNNPLMGLIHNLFI